METAVLARVCGGADADAGASEKCELCAAMCGLRTQVQSEILNLKRCYQRRQQ